MTAQLDAKDDDMLAQEHCIDLPGETVQCWIGGGTDKLKVILRKHRDVVFDINLGNGNVYTLETTESDFYNARDRKLVYAARHRRVTFKDGERMHVWVSRGFRGSLLLKCDGKLMSEVKPNEWDTQRTSDDPKEKPAPIIVTMASPKPKPKAHDFITQPTPANKIDSDHSLHVHEVLKASAPPLVLNFFESGGESLHLDSANVITRNWIIGQLAGGSGYVLDNHAWIKELAGCHFRLQKVVHRSGIKVYMVFNGNNRIRQIISASRYGISHSKVLKITGGAGGAKQAWDTAKGAAKDSIKVLAKEEGKMVLKGSAITICFTITIDIAEWYKDYSEIGPDGKPKKDFYDLFGKIGTDLIKAGMAAGLTTAVVSGFFGILAASTTALAAPVIAVVVGTIFVAAAMAYLVDMGDKAAGHALGEDDTSTWLAKKFRETGQYLADATKDVRYQYYFTAPVILVGR
jgi:hypothetical protein